MTGEPAPGALRRWWGKQVARPRYDPAVAEPLALVAADGTRLHASRLAGPAGALASVVVVHGITNSSRSPRVHAFAHAASRWAHVVVVDLRGHGRSAGRCTLGRLEALDVAAAVDAARAAAADRPVVVVGTSLGGLAAVRAAALDGTDVAGVYSLSAPSTAAVDGPDAERMRRLCATPSGRVVLRAAFRTRLERGRWDVDDLAAQLPGTTTGFTVVAHDPQERWFGPAHAEHLHGLVPEPRTLWWLPGEGHGGDLLTSRMEARIEADLRHRLAACWSQEGAPVSPVETAGEHLRNL